ncbi:hypothetical protein [Acinetobacter cumulans]|uniref:hypothetical protein n=1 Tax=Acinetobacter cumulans TaxID=2136182 RepID=UPI0020773119|nr:hypothetical protein [Acinetobacter cumulans]
MPSIKTVMVSLVALLASLVAVVLSAKGISPSLEAFLGRAGALAATLGIFIAAYSTAP